MENSPEYPGAVAPERSHTVESLGVPLRVHEWGDPAAPAVLMCHGMFDHGRGFDTLAPRLAHRFRVLALDARGHGDSGWADAYLWPADLVDIANVLRWLQVLIKTEKSLKAYRNSALVLPKLGL